MSEIGASGQNPYISQNEKVSTSAKPEVKQSEEKGVIEKIAKHPATGVAITTAAGTATAVAVAAGGALLAATPVGWGLMAGGMVAAAWSVWSAN